MSAMSVISSNRANKVILGKISQPKDRRTFLSTVLKAPALDRTLSTIGKLYTQRVLNDSSKHVGHAIKVIVDRLTDYQKRIKRESIPSEVAKLGFVQIINQDGMEICNRSNFAKWTSDILATRTKKELALLVLGYLRSVAIDGDLKRGEVIARTIRSDASFIENFSGIGGLKNFARLFSEGKLAKACSIVRPLLTAVKGTTIESLRWGNVFSGSVDEFEVLTKLFSSQENRKRYFGIKGCKQFTVDFDKITNGSLMKSVALATAVIQTIEEDGKTLTIEELGWNYAFKGNVQEFEELQRQLSTTEIRTRYSGIAGYRRFALDFNSFTDRSMSKAFVLAETILGTIEKTDSSSYSTNDLEWPVRFPSTVIEFDRLVKLFSNEVNRVKYFGETGFRVFIEDYKFLAGGCPVKSTAIFNLILMSVPRPDAGHYSTEDLGWNGSLQTADSVFEKVLV